MEQTPDKEGEEMSLAKCHKCGATLMVADDGKPYWCIECSIKEDEKRGSRREMMK